MRKLIYLYVLIFSVVKGEYLSTNGEMSLFYDTNINRLKYIRGDIFQLLNISQMGIYFHRDGQFYSMDEGVYEQKVIGTNILELRYVIDGCEVVTKIFQSMEENNNLYIKTDTSKLKWNEKFEVIYMFSPIKEASYADLDSDGYVYDDKIRFKSQTNRSRLFIATPGDFYKLEMIPVETKIKKSAGERLYLFSQIDNKNTGDKVIFHFGHSKILQNKSNGNIQSEINFWKEYNKKYKGYDEIDLKQLEFLKVLNKNYLIPEEIAYSISLPSYNDRLKIAYISSVFGNNQLSEQLVKELLYKRKNDIETIKYYTYLFNLLNLNIFRIEDKFFKSKIVPEIDSVLRRTLNDENPIETEQQLDEAYSVWELLKIYRKYYKYSDLKDEIDLYFEVLRERIKLKVDSLNGGIYNLNYVKYLNVFPEEFKRDILIKIYENHYDKKLGVLKTSKEQNINIENNLEYILELYKNGMGIEGDKLFNRIKQLIKENNNYLVPELKNNGKNYIGVYTNPLYLYLRIVQYRGMQ